jgi:hypothetical protein
VLEKLCQYFYHDLRCKQIRATRGPETPLPEFPIAPEIVLELLAVRCPVLPVHTWGLSDEHVPCQASNFLDC